MEVILKEDVKNLGEMGEVVKVAAGYGRNFLIPKGMAVLATMGNKKQLEHQLAEIEKAKAVQQAEARKLLGEIDGVSITIPKRAGDEDKLFGSVTSREVADVLTQQGHKVDRRQVDLDRPISELGIYSVPVKLASGIQAHVKVWVVAL
ncbi:50S ribosomal protein L9 [Microvenator marinus]|jgi:large subunit ribosomal protein L9|uniref:Large ribosomal subunit protein bL9 n=1 Tax=Microvenator marinus TaxID=2600177 RepID=A0A5B8XN93_9DELT|nr:50S ribosomal protein L9 [Microvenator marinus]QED27005.1 50S ribosomal protein L9 [Microvenator marinus]